MNKSAKTLEFKFERTIPAPPETVYDAWLNPKIPGTPWHIADKLILHPEVDGFFYWLIGGTPHYGRFTEMQRPGRMQHTWVSPNTLGEESMVTLTFELRGTGTLMTLVHSGIPDTDRGRGHEDGWNHFLDTFPGQFGNGTGRKDFTATITVDGTPHDLFKHITDNVAKWWGGKDLSGRTTQLNDEFIVRHANTHYSKQKLIEVIPDRKVVWLVTESKLNWIEKDKNEWTNTRMIFELTPVDGGTVLHFTHEGLVPEKECFSKCSQGWSTIIRDYLFHYCTDGTVAEQLFRETAR